MRLEPAARAANAISQLSLAADPVLIFEVDAAGVEGPAAPPRRCQVRLVGTRRRPEDGAGTPVREMSAVLVLRALTPSRLRSCVRAISAGASELPPEALCSMLFASRTDGQDLEDKQLTERELEVLRLLGEGDTTREIADRLCYSERTVKGIVHDLLAKLGCRTRSQAVAVAARSGVI
jgi:DNA-binding CsgD family transcriptional regulator